MTFQSEFIKGYWEWDEEENGIVFRSLDVKSEKKEELDKVEANAASSSCAHTDLFYRFTDSHDVWEQMDFKRNYQRHTKPDVVTLRDVKDVALFQVTSKLTSEFIDLFHTQGCDRLLRALILYFQLYLQLTEQLKGRKLTLRNPATVLVERKMHDDLATLRSMVGREYAAILLGIGNLRRFHHMANHLRTSAPERDLRIFEPLYQLAPRTVWIALSRRSLHTIEQESNRLFRSEMFTRRRYEQKLTTAERAVLGEEEEEGKLFLRSPAVTKPTQDYRLLAIGHLRINTKDPRTEHCRLAFTTPEERMTELGVTVGILGQSRRDFTAMLFPIKHNLSFSLARLSVSKDSAKRSEAIPLEGPSEEIPATFPTEPGEYHAGVRSDDTAAARAIWRAHQLKKYK